MGLEVVVHEILEEGRRQAALIEKEGLEQARAILTEANAKAQAVLDEKRDAGRRDTARVRTQEAARADFEAKRRVLVARRALWDRLREEAVRGLSGFSETDRSRHLKALLAKAARDIPEGVAHVRAQDANLVKGASRYQVVGDLAGLGGVVVESKDGRLRIDLTFETLLADIWPQVLKTESKKLFG